MNQEKIGKFITECRKEKNITQRFNKIRNASNDELEEIINESNLMAEN